MSYLVKRRQGNAFRSLMLEMAVHQAVRHGAHRFQMLDGELVSHSAGQTALRNGAAVLIGGVLVGLIPPETA